MQKIDKTILLTGASGSVGSYLRPLLRDRYRHIILSGRSPIRDLCDGESFKAAALDDFESVSEICQGVDGIIHLGGQPTEADWGTVCAANITGGYNIFEAARVAGVKRVIYASSHHAVGMYGRDQIVGSHDQPRPDSLYGVSKVFGEALASFYADKYGMRNLSIRIGNVDTVPRDHRRMSVFLHPEDLMQLISIGLESDGVHSQIVYGVSDNSLSFWDNSEAINLGYSPKHKADDHSKLAVKGEEAAPRVDEITFALQGATFASHNYQGDLKRTLKTHK